MTVSAMNGECAVKAGQALVIVGPKGSGKSQLARTIARMVGEWREIHADSFVDPFGLGEAIHSGARTLICDGMPASNVALTKIAAMVKSGTVRVDRKGLAPYVTKTPHLIFCLEADAVPHQLLESRRFKFVHVKRARKAGA